MQKGGEVQGGIPLEWTYLQLGKNMPRLDVGCEGSWGGGRDAPLWNILTEEYVYLCSPLVRGIVPVG